MKLNPYINLINSMPVNEQAFWSKRQTWVSSLKPKKLSGKFDELFNERFEEEKWAHISRADILEETDIEKIIYMTIVWGYPSGMRNNYFKSIVKNIDHLIYIIKFAKEKGCIDNWMNHFEEIREIRGLGLSTYSKLLYFNKIKIEGFIPAILDLRLLSVFRESVYEEFEELSFLTYCNAPSNYLLYLKTMKSVAEKLKVNIDNLEMFLFSFGENIKEQQCDRDRNGHH